MKYDHEKTYNLGVNGLITKEEKDLEFESRFIYITVLIYLSYNTNFQLSLYFLCNNSNGGKFFYCAVAYLSKEASLAVARMQFKIHSNYILTKLSGLLLKVTK